MIGPMEGVDPEATALIGFLDAQRAAVLAIVAGLDDEALRARPLPSGWSPLGLVEHLGLAERHWFGEVATGSAPDLPWAEREPAGDPGDPGGPGDPGDLPIPFTTARPPAAVFAFYRDEGARSDAVLASTPLSARPVGRHVWQGEVEHVPDLRWIALHVLEETARHAGHLDVVRELLDGRTGLGPR